MSLGKKLFIGSSAAGACPTDSVQPFGADSAYSSNVALYQLDSDGGTTNNVPDTVGNYNGTATNVTYSTGKYGNAANFSSTNYITVTGITSTSTFSYSLWVKPTNASSSGFKGVFGKQNTEGQLFTDSGALKIWTTTTQTFTGSPTLSDNVWSHIVLSVSNGTGTIYINGINKGTATGISLPSTLYMGTASTQIGNSTYGYQGLIDQVRIYDKALSLNEVEILYNETTDTVSDTNVLGEGSGVALYSLDYDASDAGGNHDGTSTDVDFGVDGQINWGASFNGSSSKIEFTPDSNFVNDFTISAWINMNQLPVSGYLYQVVAWGDEATGERRSLGIWNGGSGDPKVYFSGYGASANFGGNTSVSANQWYHICVTRSGSTVKVYLNGSLDGTGTVTLNYYTGTTGRIGASGSAQEFFNGTIDQVRIFSKALSQNEVSTLYGETACVYTSTTDNNDYPVTNAAYYKLDNNAEDAKGNYDGTATNVNYEFGRYGQAAVFNGSSSYITANKSMFGTGDGTADVFTISLWFNTTTNNGILAGTRGNSATQGFIIWLLSDGTIRYDEVNATGSVDTLITTNTYDDGNWHNVVVTRNASNQATLYVDGSVQVATKTISTPLTSHTYNLTIGKYTQNSLYYNGSIDQVRIYNSALDATAVENLYNEKQAYITKNASDPFGDGNEVAFYKLENNANDSTGSNTGVANGVTFTSGSGLFGTYAAEFNGSSSYIQTSLSQNSDNIAISFWMKADVTGGTSPILMINNRNGVIVPYAYGTGSNSLTANTTNQNILLNSTTFTSQWNHIVINMTGWASSYTAGAFDGSINMEVFVNGSSIGTTTNKPYGQSDGTRLGRSNGSYYFDGKLDQIRVFDRALDGDEVFKLYAEVLN